MSLSMCRAAMPSIKKHRKMQESGQHVEDNCFSWVTLAVLKKHDQNHLRFQQVWGAALLEWSTVEYM